MIVNQSTNQCFENLLALKVAKIDFICICGDFLIFFTYNQDNLFCVSFANVFFIHSTLSLKIGRILFSDSWNQIFIKYVVFKKFYNVARCGFFRGKIQQNLVKMSITVSNKLWPARLQGRGSTRSMLKDFIGLVILRGHNI